ncbi:ethanolamine permease [Pollutibacter soli]|uniref:ethanolamine permease n=1 Tax=Pollutibacter soli TaxID=3034157 RepID=UPI003013E4B9
MASNTTSLKKTLTPLSLWGLGVGYVISGMYFGWNLGLEQGGTYGLAIATVFIIVMYTCFSFSYAELACAIPKAGGVFDYAGAAFGKNMGFVAGLAQIIEFVFAPPAISAAVGAYFNAFFPSVPVILIAIIAYIIFTCLNIYGVKAAANFETFVTVLAVAELLLFCGLTLPHTSTEKFSQNAFPNGWAGVFASVPFAIWFFLGIEGIANVAEESLQPQKDISKGFGWSLVTLVILCILVFYSAAAINGWESIVYTDVSKTTTSDSPLPLALKIITGDNSLMYHLLITVGLFGLIASFHGLILAAGRSTYEMGKAGNLPGILGRISPKFQTPANALLGNMVIGIIALLSGRTGQIITISVFGALTLYIISMLSLFRLRKKSPELARPFHTPGYPWFPAIALVIAIFSLIAMMVYNLYLGLLYFAILLTGFILFKLFTKTTEHEQGS